MFGFFGRCAGLHQNLFLGPQDHSLKILQTGGSNLKQDCSLQPVRKEGNQSRLKFLSLVQILDWSEQHQCESRHRRWPEELQRPDKILMKMLQRRAVMRSYNRREAYLKRRAQRWLANEQRKEPHCWLEEARRRDVLERVTPLKNESWTWAMIENVKSESRLNLNYCCRRGLQRCFFNSVFT